MPIILYSERSAEKEALCHIKKNYSKKYWELLLVCLRISVLVFEKLDDTIVDGTKELGHL